MWNTLTNQPAKAQKKRRNLLLAGEENKCRPRKLIHHKNSFKSKPAYWEYNMLRLKEQYKHRQIDYVDGKTKGLKLILIAPEKATEMKKELYTVKEWDKDFTQNYSSNTKKQRGNTRKQAGRFHKSKLFWEELMSSRTKATTVDARSPKSVFWGKELQNLNPNEGGIHNYFMAQEMEKKDCSHVFKITKCSTKSESNK